MLQAIGDKYGKSIAQIALHWLVQRDIVAIPKSVRRERMEQNLDITDFVLSQEDMDAIATLNLGHGIIVNFEDPQVRLGLQQALKKYSV